MLSPLEFVEGYHESGEEAAGWALAACDGVLLALALPAARMGVRKWFI